MHRRAENERPGEPAVPDVASRIDDVLAAAATVPGWTRDEDARAIAQASAALPDDPVLVEVGVFMGRCTVLLAGARRLRGSGVVHCIDPFDCSGDAFSTPHYRRLLASAGEGSLEAAFRKQMAKAGLLDWIEIHRASSAETARSWSWRVDLLLLDGDQSPAGARSAYEAWYPFLKANGTIILRNTADRAYAEGHDGHRRLVIEEILPPRFSGIRQIGATTIATKA